MFEVARTRPDGTISFRNVHKMPLRDEDDNVIGIVGISEDVSEKKQTQENLKTSQQLLKTVFDTVPVGLQAKDLNGTYLLVNSCMASFSGNSPEALKGKTFRDLGLGSEEEIEAVEADDRRVIETGKLLDDPDYPLTLRDGKTIWRHRIKAPLKDENGEVVGIVGVMEDTTEHRKAERDLLESRKLLQEVVDAIPHSIFLRDKEGRFVLANKALATLHGLEVEDLIGIGINDLPGVAPEEKAQWVEQDRQVIDTGNPVEIPETKVTLPDGTSTFRRIIRVPFCGNEKDVVGVLSISEDITDRRLAEQREKATERLLQTVFDTIPHWVFVKDGSGRYLMGNSAFAQSFNLSADELRGLHTTDFGDSTPEQRKVFLQSDRQVMRTGNPMEIPDYTVGLPGGMNQTRRIRKMPLKDEGGNTVAVVCLSEDITASKKAHEELLSAKQKVDEANKQLSEEIAERMKADRVKDEFLAIVSHELKTPLTAIHGALGLLTGKVGTGLPTEARNLLDVAWKNSTRLTQLIYELLDFQKLEKGDWAISPEPLDLVVLVKQTIEEFQPNADQFSVELVLEDSLEKAKVRGESTGLVQVISNLLSNAAKFSPVGGTVKISVTRQRDSICVAVKDQGQGIPEDFRPFVFEKFAQADTTDRRKRGGTGLGLTIAKRIVERFGGEIAFDSGNGGGTTFYFLLPELPDPS
jgi:PAS domain S-box-containing protein